MPKQIILIRHAKSDWADGSLSDIERPLNKRGHKNAPEMAERLVKKNYIPQLMVSSTALRAFTTAQYFAKAMHIPESAIRLESSIYEAHHSKLLAVINQLDNKYNRVALFGHNPGMSNLAHYLCDEYIDDMPTGAVVVIEFPFEIWEMVSGGTGIVNLYDYPKKEK